MLITAQPEAQSKADVLHGLSCSKQNSQQLPELSWSQHPKPQSRERLPLLAQVLLKIPPGEKQPLLP